ncbi:MAG TPA: glycoside hydrolase family 32 protein [Bacteroidales bacterium]|nr:glycoside hydrolase family 32 protein [Bacteroidales bacterium]
MKNIKNCTLFFLLVLCTFSLAGQNSTDQVLRKEIKIKKGQTYLNLPVKTSDRLLKATLRFNGKPLDQFTINLAGSDPDFWTFFDVTPYQGKTIVIEVANAPVRSFGPAQGNSTNPPELRQDVLNLIYADSRFPGQDSLYREKDRPQVHFSANRGWINDPNGLINYNNEYHMFFQHNPYGWQWGNMHWGHAVSHDLIRWEQQKEALYPVIETAGIRGDAAFSGSAVYDPENTSGFRRNGIDPLIAVYTSTGRGECLQLSYDNGQTFEDYSGNPVLKHNGRDPKVFWYEPEKHWVMVVWESGKPSKLSNGAEVNIREHSIYNSADLKTWTYQSGIQGFFECPELFELPVEGQPGVSKWVMYDANGRYIVGKFDGKKFDIEQHFTRYENGGGYFYASQTFNNSPDGRRIQVGWGRNITHPGMPFNQPMLFPSELKLRSTLNGYRLCPSPITEIKNLFGNTKSIENKLIQTGEKVGFDVDASKPLHILAEIERGDAPISLNIMGYILQYDNEWTFSASSPDKDIQKTVAPSGPFPAPVASTPVTYVSPDKTFRIEAIVDKNLLEFYINGGELYYVTAFNGEKLPVVEVLVAGADNQRMGTRKFLLKKLEVNDLISIWSK